MKLKNILSVFCCVVAMASCSMEDDALMNDISKEIESAQGEAKEAYVAVKMDLDGLSTKSVTPGDPSTDNIADQEIKTLALFLLDGDNVINKAFFATGEFSRESDGTLKSNGKVFGFLTKKKNTLSLIAVANTDNGILTKTSRNDIATYAAVLGDCVKYQDVPNFGWFEKDGSTPYPGYEKINGDDGVLAQEPAYVKIVLKQSYARVELASFNVIRNAAYDKTVDVQLTNVELLNLNAKGQANGVLAGTTLENSSWNFQNAFPVCSTADAACSNAPGKNILAGSNIFFRTFAHNYSNSNQSNKLCLKLTYKVGVKTRTKEIIIEGKEAGLFAVEAGYIYRVNLTATLRPEQVDLDVIFSIDKWIDGGILVDGELTVKGN